MELTQQAEIAKAVLRLYMSQEQMMVMETASKGEEGTYFLELFVKLAALIESTPQSLINNIDADFGKAHLHYFTRGSDWYILERSRDGELDRAYGYAILNGDLQNAEYGYIDISELIAHGAELDLYFTPKKISQALAKRHGLTE
jgi:hypothetical protein